jgi:hypothetical protein
MGEGKIKQKIITTKLNTKQKRRIVCNIVRWQTHITKKVTFKQEQ